jgi:Tol biopolymer transport system component
VVAFTSSAPGLVAGDTNETEDVFVHNVRSGVTERISVSSGGVQANNSSFNAALSGRGRYVAFTSGASNLAAGDHAFDGDVFVRDRRTDTTELVSVGIAGEEANGDSGEAPAISADGRYVSFVSQASNLVPGDVNSVADVFVYDRQTKTTQRVSVRTDGRQVNAGSFFPSMSSNGRYVAFFSGAPRLVLHDTNQRTDVFVHDTFTGATKRVSVATGGAEANGASGAYASISGDGRVVAFSSRATNLVPGTRVKRTQMYVHNRVTGRTRLVSRAIDGSPGDSWSNYVALSHDATRVVFTSHSSDLVEKDTNATQDVFVRIYPTGP